MHLLAAAALAGTFAGRPYEPVGGLVGQTAERSATHRIVMIADVAVGCASEAKARVVAFQVPWKDGTWSLGSDLPTVRFMDTTVWATHDATTATVTLTGVGTASPTLTFSAATKDGAHRTSGTLPLTVCS